MDDNYSSKIPYDNEPIFREQKSRKSRGNSSSSGDGVGFNKFFALLFCLLILFNIVLAIVVFTKPSGNTTNNYKYDVYPESFDASAVATKAMPSAVLVNAGFNSGTSINSSNFNSMRVRGAGVIIKDDKEAGTAYILTCNHVIRSYSNQIYIMLSDCSQPLSASRVYSSTNYDLAVVKIENKEEYKNSNAHPCEIADSNYVSVGEDVLVIGNPLGQGFSCAEGSVSVALEFRTSSDSPNPHRAIRISAPINEGNSGGGVFNSRGQLLGISFLKTESYRTGSGSVDVDGMSYVIPSTLATNIAFNIIRKTIPAQADFGMTLSDGLFADGKEQMSEIINGKEIIKKPAIVQSLEPGSVAYRAGINVGDRIVGMVFDGNMIDIVNRWTIEDYAFAMDIGTEVTFVIERDGHTINKTLVVESTILADPSV